MNVTAEMMKQSNANLNLELRFNYRSILSLATSSSLFQVGIFLLKDMHARK